MLWKQFVILLSIKRVQMFVGGGRGTLEIKEKLGLLIKGYYLTLIKGIVQNKLQLYFDLFKELTFVINH